MLDHLSYSSISAYVSCPRSFRFHYLDKVETPTSPSLLFGSAFHDTVEDYLRMKVQDPPTCPPDQYWLTHWGKQLEQNPNVTWNGETPEELSNLGIRMLAHKDIAEILAAIKPQVVDGQPAIERKVALQVPGVDVPIIGYIDLIEEDGIPADFKTAARSWGSDKANSEVQPVFYLAALNQAGYQQNKGLEFRHYVFVKTKTPKVEIWKTQRQPGELFWLFGMIRDVWQGIKANVFPPSPGTWKCTPKFCDYWTICRGKS